MAYRALFLIIILWPSLAAAGIFEDYAGIRSAAMGGALRAIGSSNEAIYLNPATMAVFKRFGVDLELAYEKPQNLRRMRASAVDSKTSQVAVGIGYEVINEAPGLPTLKRTSIGVAHPLGEHVFFGSTAHYISGTRIGGMGEESFETFNTDIGIALNLSDALQLGMSWYNVVETKERALSPESMAFGIAAGNEIFITAFDVRLEDDESGNSQATYYAGAEFLLAGAIPIRAGYTRKPPEAAGEKATNLVSGGLAYLTKTGALSLTLERSFSESSPWSLATAIKFFM